MADWTDLTAELDAWRDSGRRATFWWRDDDAGGDVVRLQRLLDMRRGLGVPLALAVVPGWLTRPVEAAIREAAGVRVLQHGVNHDDRTGGSRRRTELAAGALASGLRQALIRSRAELDVFPRPLLIDVMVPPWNRIDDDVLAILSGCGFLGLSAFGPRRSARTAGLEVNNVHIDIVDWRRGRRFAGEADCLAAAIRHLRRRRLGTADPAEVTGLMTHHLVHDLSCERFIERFAGVVRDHPAARWLSAAAVFDGRLESGP